MQVNHFSADSGVYLLSHSVGRPLVSASEHLENHFFATWRNDPDHTWDHWLTEINHFREAIARLFNAKSQDVCPQVNLSSALTKIIPSLKRPNSKTKILLSEEDFPSIGFVLKMAAREGYQLKFIPKTENLLDLNVWDKYITDDVGFALISHAYSNTGLQTPILDIVRLCERQDVVSIVDIAQSAGILPIDFTRWNADFVIGSCVKWLCGGPGAGYLWVNPDIISSCQPVDVGWFSHDNPFEFDIYNFKYADGALRFWGGTPSVIQYVVARQSINTIIDISIAQIRQHNLRLGQMMIDEIAEEFLVSPSAEMERNGTLIFDFANRQARVSERLNRAQVRFDAREYGLRLSPHIYNNESEIETVIEQINSALK